MSDWVLCCHQLGSTGSSTWKVTRKGTNDGRWFIWKVLILRLLLLSPLNACTFLDIVRLSGTALAARVVRRIGWRDGLFAGACFWSEVLVSIRKRQSTNIVNTFITFITFMNYAKREHNVSHIEKCFCLPVFTSSHHLRTRSPNCLNFERAYW